MSRFWRHARRVDEVDWARWEPLERATLLFLRRQDEILLIHKKRGLGAGKLNGPGGRMEPGETPLECAVRETKEEVGLDVFDAAHAGQISFQFVDGFSIQAEVFRAYRFRGEAIETDEAKPEWFPVRALPFDRMWADDAFWLPLLLAGQDFRGRFVFDGETMLDHDVVRL